MAFDLGSAKPVGFDLNSAQPVPNQAVTPNAVKAPAANSRLRDFVVGAGMGAADFSNTLARGLGAVVPDAWEQAAGQALGMASSVDEAIRNQQAAYRGITNDSTAGKVGRFVGNVAAVSPSARIKLGASLLKAAPALVRASPVLEGAMQGGASGLALSSADLDRSPVSQAGTGAVVGGVVAGVLPPLARTVKGAASTLLNGAGKEQTMARAADELAAQANALYQQADEAGVLFKQSAVQNVANDIKQAVGRPNTILRPKTSGMLQELDDMAASGDISLSRLDEFRQMIGKEMRRADPSDMRTLQMMKNRLDDFGDNAGPNAVTGDYQNGLQLIKEARKAWAMKSKAQILDDIFEKAENNTSQYTQNQYLGTVLQKFRQLANDPRKMRAFSKDEQAQIKQIVLGGKTDRVLRLLGKMAPTGAVSTGAGVGVGGMVAGPTGMVAVPLLGAGAKYAATQSTKAAIRRLEDQILQGQVPLARSQAISTVPNSLQALLQASYLPKPAPAVAGWSMFAQEPKAK